jgi:VCBS repeat-containing protein
MTGVTEDGNVTAGNLETSGNISITDADQNQEAFNTTVTAAQGNLGTLVLSSSGGYTYTVANSAVQYLGAGQTKIETFTIRSVDGTAKDVSFTIVGTNDAAEIGTPSVSSVTEDVGVNGSGNLVASGTIGITDADQGQAVFITAVTATQGNLGSLVLGTDGSYTYSVANNTVQGLISGQSRVDTFTVQAADGTTKQLSFNIHGTDDTAVIGTPSVNAVTEDASVTGGNLVANGTISITDADQGQGSFNTTATAAQGNLGSLALSADGSYTYSVANNAVQYLGAGQTKVDTFTIHSDDGTARDVSFTINGSNDAAVIGTLSVDNVTEDVGVNASGNLVASGTISITDADQGQAVFNTVVTAAQGNLGALSLDASGSYTYSVANSAVQFLGTGQSKIDTFTIRSVDGTTKDVSFTINGANDAAVIGTPTASSVTEDVSVSSGNLLASGSIGITDADQGQAAFNTTVTAAQGNLGSLTLSANGSYTYSAANSAVQYLGAGQSRIDTFTAQSVDGTTKQLSFTIQGANDAPVVSAAVTGNTTEDGSLVTLNALANASDADTGTTLSVVNVPGTLPTGVSYNAATKIFTLDPSNATFQDLAAGQVRTVSVTYGISDGTATTSQTVTFTLTGTDDAPLITSNGGASTAAVTVYENTTSVTTVTATDVDTPTSNLTYSIVGGADQLKFNINSSTGALSFAPAPNFEAPNDVGANNVYDVVVRASDGSLSADQAIAVTVANVNDAPSGTDKTVAVTEDQAYTFATGDFGFTDTDSPANSLLAVKIATLPNSTYGQLYLNNVALTGVVSVTAQDIADGRLTFVPTANSTTTTGFTFQVQDNGGTANGGVNLDPTPNTMTLSLTAGATVAASRTTGGVNSTYDIGSLAANSGSVSVLDSSGTDSIAVQTTSSAAVFTTFDFVHSSNNLQFNEAGTGGTGLATHLTILNQYAGAQIETLSFANGGTVATFSLGTASYTLSTAGTTAADIVAGSSADETISGGTGGDLLFGSAGNDYITGGGGLDLLSGGLGSDTFVFDSTVGNTLTQGDVVTDFTSGTDSIAISRATFTGLTTTVGNVLSSSEFVQVASGGSSNSVGAGIHVIYDSGAGNLYYDPDGGTASTTRILLAHVVGSISQLDIHVI